MAVLAIIIKSRVTGEKVWQKHGNWQIKSMAVELRRKSNERLRLPSKKRAREARNEHEGIYKILEC